MTATVYTQNDAVVELHRRGVVGVDRNLVSYLVRDPLRKIPHRKVGGSKLLDERGLDRLEAAVRDYLDNPPVVRSA